MTTNRKTDEQNGVKAQRLNEIRQLARSVQTPVAEAASQALTKIAAGHPAKPLLNEVQTLEQAAAYRHKYPPLSRIPAGDTHTIRLGRYFDTLDEDALQRELTGLTALWGSDNNNLERAYLLNDHLHKVVEEWQTVGGDQLLTLLAPQLAAMTLAQWCTLSEKLAQIATTIHRAVETGRGND